jgi:hypothetical protein
VQPSSNRDLVIVSTTVKGFVTNEEIFSRLLIEKRLLHLKVFPPTAVDKLLTMPLVPRMWKYLFEKFSGSFDLKFSTHLHLKMEDQVSSSDASHLSHLSD